MDMFGGDRALRRQRLSFLGANALITEAVCFAEQGQGLEEHLARCRFRNPHVLGRVPRRAHLETDQFELSPHDADLDKHIGRPQPGAPRDERTPLEDAERRA